MKVDGEPIAPCAYSEEMVGSEGCVGGVGLNHGAGILGDLWGNRGWQPRLGLNIFGVFQFQTLDGLAYDFAV